MKFGKIIRRIGAILKWLGTCAETFPYEEFKKEPEIVSEVVTEAEVVNQNPGEGAGINHG